MPKDLLIRFGSPVLGFKLDAHMRSQEARRGASGIVVVEVGPEHQAYHLHRAFLEERSEYFRKALNGPWKEAEDRVIVLDDVEPAIFNIFVEWLYTQKIPGHDLDWFKVMGISKFNHPGNFYMAMVKAYALADRLLAIEFRQQVQSKIVKGHIVTHDPRYIFYDLVQLSFTVVSEDSPMLQFLVDIFVQHWEPGKDGEDAKLVALRELPPEFLVRAMRQYAMRRESSQQRYRPACYLDHLKPEYCRGTHMTWDATGGFGYFKPDPW